MEKAAAGSRADTDWAALGVAYLVSEQFDKALEFLEASVATPAPNPVWLSDLSAAYLLVARRRERYELVPKAVAAAELAYRLDGRLREAAFNRALALEAIHLPGQAQNAWRAYRSLDLDSDWSGEALAHLSKLEQEAADTQTRWSSVDQTIDSAASGHGFDSKTIGRSRHRLRARIETDLLPAWADRELADDTAGALEQLRRARTAADLLARAGGDQMPKDAIRAIEEADRGANRTLVRRLARAHLGFRDVSKIFDAGRVTEADEKFHTISADLIAGHDPYANWSAIYGAVAHYGARQFDQARALLTAGQLADIDGRYRYLAGRRRWIAGLHLGQRGPVHGVADRVRRCSGKFSSGG